MSQHDDMIATIATASLAPVDNEDFHQITVQSQKHVNIALQLDALPAELRHYMLLFLDLESLSALVHASPIYHAQYREDRGRILSQSVEYTAPEEFMSRLFRSRNSEFKQDVAGFLQSYSGAKARQELTREGPIDLNTAVEMARFYFTKVKPLANKFACTLLEKLAQEAAHPDVMSEPDPRLSGSERARITRSIYRLELYCVALHTDKWIENLTGPEDTQAFLDTFEPWETEELFSFYNFTKGIYVNLIESVKSDIHPDNPRFDDQPRAPTPTGSFDIDNSPFTEEYVGSLVLKGIEFLHTAIFVITDHEDLVSLVQENMMLNTCHLGGDLDFAGERYQETRYTDGTERGEKMDNQTPMPFQGDERSDTPPLGWTTLWGEVYSSLFGREVPDALQPWGYIFWDASRLKSTGALEMIERAMKNWTDPRDREAQRPYGWARDFED